MLLATYQPRKPLKKERTESAKTLEKYIGYYPVFCFCANTPHTALVGSLLSAPNCAEILYFVNTDTYDYIDVVEWCLYLKTGNKYHIEAGLNNNCPVERREYLVKEACLNESSLSVDLSAVLSGEIKIDWSATDYPDEMMQEYVARFNEIYTALREHANAFVVNSVFEKEPFLENRIQKIAFENYLLGMFAHLANPGCKENGIYLMNMQVYGKHLLNITQKIARFYNDNEDACYTTPAAFDEIYRILFSLVWNVYWNEKPHRNDKCPCGSGKKFKKCHGYLR